MISEQTRFSKKRLKSLEARGKVLRLVRDFFFEKHFLEVETPLLVPAPGLEVHLKSIRAGGNYLITSPEYQMKRLLVSGLKDIYTICKCFRDEESGPQHNSEFTMLEWYRAGQSLEKIQTDTEDLVTKVLLEFWPDGEIIVSEKPVSFQKPWPRTTVRSLMEKHAGVLLRGDESIEELKDKFEKAGHTFGNAKEWDDIFFTVFLDHVEPALRSMNTPVFVAEWPVKLGALAKCTEGSSETVQRFEAYIGGIELANAFGELTCAQEQHKRFEDDLAYRSRNKLHVPPLDEKFLSALEEGMPESSGIALGIDRLVMLASGSQSIKDVLTFDTQEL